MTAVGSDDVAIFRAARSEYDKLLADVRWICEAGNKNGWVAYPDAALQSARHAAFLALGGVEGKPTRSVAVLRDAIRLYDALPLKLRDSIEHEDYYDPAEKRIRAKHDVPRPLTEAEANQYMGILDMLYGQPFERRAAEPSIVAAIAEVDRVYDRTRVYRAEPLRALAAAWKALPASRRRALLGGWSVPAAEDFPDRRPLYESAAVNSRFLVMHSAPGPGLFVTQDYEPTCGTAAVRLAILEGSSQTEVAEALRGMLALVEGQWQRLIAMRPAAVFQNPKQKEGDHPEATCTRPRDGREGAEALDPAAA